VFPRALKASPLLRAWLARLAGLGVRISVRHRWQGFAADGALLVNGQALRPAATVLALGGASWPRLGSDGAWPALLPGCAVAPLRPANMGFAVAWSAQMAAQAGQPLKRIAARFGTATLRGEAMLTAAGLEGGVIYALSAALRDAIAAHGPQTLWLDLRPDLDAAALAQRLGAAAASISTRLRKAGLAPPAIALVQEALHAGAARSDLAALVKAVPVTLHAPQPLARDDVGRMATGELVYTGVERTPVAAMVRRLRWQNEKRPVASELYAQSRDIWLVLGGLPENPLSTDTADGGPFTADAARVRLARVLLIDPPDFSPLDAVAAARQVARLQARQVARALRKVLRACGWRPTSLVLSGHGECLARAALERLSWNLPVVELRQLLGPAISRAAPAHSLALIAQGWVP
jgi:hypothetical protein